MRIAIDARWIFREISGIGAYTRELVRNLADIDTRNEYVLLFSDASLRDRTVQEAGLGGRPNVSSVVLRYGVFSPMGQLLLPLTLRSRGIDVYHSTNYLIPLLAFPRGSARGPRCVTTIHDVIPLIFPDHAPRSRKARLFPVYRRLMIEIGRRSHAIITDSLASKADVIRQLAIPTVATAKVRHIYCGVSSRFSPASPPRAPRGQADVRTVLYVGRADPYKNLVVLVRAFAELMKTAPFPVRLIVAGTPDPRYPEAQLLADELGIAGSVRWTGYVSDDEMLTLYRDADVLAHPSRYEGFGLQVAEAMACGLPVICSNAGSLPEVAGDVAIMLDPDDAAGYATQARRVLVEPALAADLSARGIARAAQFTWRRAAAETLRVYEEVHERR